MYLHAYEENGKCICEDNRVFHGTYCQECSAVG